MHPNPAFRRVERARTLAFAADRGFGAVSINGPEGPLASHVPFVVVEDGAGGARAEAHLVRATPIARALAAAGAEGAPALLAVSGPDAYISPDWYGLDHDQVPTWNYVAAHLRGVARLAPAEGLRAHLDALSAAFEARLAPKPPWTMDKMTPDAIARLMRALVPVSLAIESVEGTWKLNQNKPDAGRRGAADALAALDRDAPGSEAARLAALMRAVEAGEG